MQIQSILTKDTHSKDEIIRLLNADGDDEKLLFDFSNKIKLQNVGNTVYLRGLIELSNICEKDCYYCGIRKSNSAVHRYSISEEEVLEAVRFAYENGYGSVAIQSGEIQSPAFTEKINRILKASKELTNGEIGITLSCGEQTEETYRQWFESGAHRYLLRIESSSEELYRKIHPNDKIHNYEKRLEALHTLKKIGYQVGTGVMIGLPFQTFENLADDLLFMKQFDIDMCGMGPYIEHHETPLYAFKDSLMPFRSAGSVIMLSTTFNKACSENGAFSSSILPASIFEKSRISLIIRSKASAATLVLRFVVRLLSTGALLGSKRLGQTV